MEYSLNAMRLAISVFFYVQGVGDCLKQMRNNFDGEKNTRILGDIVRPTRKYFKMTMWQIDFHI